MFPSDVWGTLAPLGPSVRGDMSTCIIPSMPTRSMVVVAPTVTDLATAPEFEADLARAEEGSEVLVDCSAVEFMDSTGLRVLIAARNRLEEGGGSLAVLNPSRPVKRLLQITDMEGLIRD